MEFLHLDLKADSPIISFAIGFKAMSYEKVKVTSRVAVLLLLARLAFAAVHAGRSS